MPYKVYESDPAWAAGAGNLASALFPDPSKQMEYQALALKGRETEQDIRAKHRELNLADMLMDATRGNNTNEMYALGAGMSPQHMNAMPGFALGRAATPGAGTSDEDMHRMAFGSGMNLGPDSSVSIGRQDAVSARNAQEAYRLAMDKERLSQAGEDRRNEPGSTASIINREYNVMQRLRNNPGMTQQHAWALELGDASVKQNEQGHTTYMDAAGMQAQRIPTSGLSGRPQFEQFRPVDPESDLSFNPGEGTGLLASAQGLWNKTGGQIIPSMTAMGPESAARNTEMLRLDLSNAMRSSSRMLAIEAQMISGQLPDSMAWSQNPRVAQQDMARVLDMASQRYLRAVSNANDDTMHRTQQAEWQEVADLLQNVLSHGLRPEAMQELMSHVSPYHGYPVRPRGQFMAGDGSPPLEVNVGGGGGGEQQFPPGTRTFENPDTGERKAVLPDGREFMY